MLKFLPYLILPFLIISNCSAQRAIPLIAGTSKIGRESVVTTGKPKSEMFQSARSWIKRKYPDYFKMIQVFDVAGGQIKYKTTADLPYGRYKSMMFTVTIDIKEKKYKCTIDGLHLMGRLHNFYDAATAYDFSVDGEVCEAASKRFSEIEDGLREYVTSEGPTIARPNF
jgi:hypothetical protein